MDLDCAPDVARHWSLPNDLRCLGKMKCHNVGTASSSGRGHSAGPPRTPPRHPPPRPRPARHRRTARNHPFLSDSPPMPCQRPPPPHSTGRATSSAATMGRTKRKGHKAEAASRTSSSADHTNDYSGGGGWSSLPWKSLASATSTAGDTNANTGDNDGHGDGIMFDEEDVGYNHYDDPDAADWSELYGDPATTAGGKKRGAGKGRDRPSEADSIEGADDPGILLGLEVVDGSLYEVKREKVGAGGAVTRVVATVNAGTSESSAAASAPAKTSNKKKRKLVEAATLKDDGPNKDTLTNDGPNSDVDSASDPDGGGGGGDDDDDDDKAALADIQKEIRKLKNKARRKKAKLRKKEMRKKQLDEKDTATNNESNKAEKSGNEEDLDSAAEPTEQDINTIRTSWSVAAPGVYLHDVLCRGLALQGFAMPTPIQASTLPASILGRRDIVGAAPTGSGKTLAYAIPMLQGILAARDSRSATSSGIGDKDDSKSKSGKDGAAGGIEPLTGLVLCPTRELVVQVTSEIKGVGCNEVEVGTIVGGLAEQKQKRVLDVKRPPILVATPGRLWELVSLCSLVAITWYTTTATDKCLNDY